MSCLSLHVVTVEVVAASVRWGVAQVSVSARNSGTCGPPQPVSVSLPGR